MINGKIIKSTVFIHNWVLVENWVVWNKVEQRHLFSGNLFMNFIIKIQTDISYFFDLLFIEFSSFDRKLS